MNNYYEILEVSPNASSDVIKSAYKCLVRKYHPDSYDGDKAFAESVMKSLNEAFEVLSDDERRRTYNASLQIRSRSNKQEKRTDSQDRPNTHQRYYPEQEETAQPHRPPNFQASEKAAQQQAKAPWYAQDLPKNKQSHRKTAIILTLLGAFLLLLLLGHGCKADLDDTHRYQYGPGHNRHSEVAIDVRRR